MGNSLTFFLEKERPCDDSSPFSKLQDLWHLQGPGMKSLAKQQRNHFPLVHPGPSASVCGEVVKGTRKKHARCGCRFGSPVITKLWFFSKAVLFGKLALLYPELTTNDSRMWPIYFWGAARGQWRQEKRLPYVVSIKFYQKGRLSPDPALCSTKGRWKSPRALTNLKEIDAAPSPSPRLSEDMHGSVNKSPKQISKAPYSAKKKCR